MKTKIRATRKSLLFLLLLLVPASLSAQEFHSVHDGVEYAGVMRTVSGQPVRMNLLRIDLSKV